MAKESPSRREKPPFAAPDENRFDDEGAPPKARRPGRFGWLKLVLGTVFVLGLSTAVALGARHFAVSSHRFALEYLKVEGSTRFSDAQLLSLMGIERGDNLFALDLHLAEQSLAEHPWIASAKLTRKLPSTLELEVAEYRAEALAAIGDTLYLVTRDGYPIAPNSPEEHADYPVITGVTLEQLVADRKRALERVARGVELLRKYARSPLASNYEAQELHLGEDGSLELVVGQSGVTLVLGSEPITQKLLMAARVVNKVRARGENPTLVFLDNEAHPERVVVRLR